MKIFFFLNNKLIKNKQWAERMNLSLWVFDFFFSLWGGLCDSIKWYLAREDLYFILIEIVQVLWITSHTTDCIRE